LRHFGKLQVSSGGKDDGASFEESILKWVQEEVKEYDLDVSNFRTSFNDGKAFLALCHKLNPDSVDYHNIDLSNSVSNASLAFKIAEERFNIPLLLNPQNLSEGKEKEKSLVLYLSLLHNVYTNENEKKKMAGFSETKTLSLQEQITMLEEENMELKENIQELTEEVEVLQKSIETEAEEKVELNLVKDETLVKVKQEREQLKEGNQKLEKENESMIAENDELLNQIKKTEKQREKLEEMISSIKKESKPSLDDLEKVLTMHLRHMHAWKDYLKKEGKDFESEKAKLQKEKEINGMDIFNQLASIAQSLAHEDLKIQYLQKEREEKESKEKEAKQKLTEKPKKEEEKKKKKN